ILFAENVDLGEWNVAPNEYSCAVIWDPTATSFTPLDETINVNTAPNGYLLARPSSRHQSGFNVSMVDGSVRFIRDSINYSVYARLLSSSGRRTVDRNGPNTPTLGGTPMADGTLQGTAISDTDVN